jgi:hypothetical protein
MAKETISPLFHTWKKIAGIQLLVLKFESLDGKLSEKCVGRWTLNGIPLPLRN